MIVSTQPPCTGRFRHGGDLRPADQHLRRADGEQAAGRRRDRASAPAGDARAARRPDQRHHHPRLVLLTAAVTDGSPDQAVGIANAVGDAFIRDVAQIEQPPTRRRPPGRGEGVPAGPAPCDLVAPRPRPLPGVRGRARPAGRVRRRGDPQRAGHPDQEQAPTGGGPRGAGARHHRARPQDPVEPAEDVRAAARSAEAFRSCGRTSRSRRSTASTKSILVTSATSGEGRTTTVCNLGLALAKAGARVVIVDADLRNPSIARSLQHRGTPGLTDVLADRTSRRDRRAAGRGRRSTRFPAGCARRTRASCSARNA